MVSCLSSWLAERYPETAPLDFYRELFPVGELERRGEYTDRIPGAVRKYCGIAVRIVQEGGRTKAMRYSVTDDLDTVGELVGSNDFCVMSPVSYAGKTQKQSMSRFIYAVVFDLDGVRVKDGCPVGLQELIYQIGEISETAASRYALPVPTYIVSSGTGLHLYYFLERPVPLFRNVIEQLGNMRRDLCQRIWNRQITTLSSNIQFESVTQGFRMVGTVSKDGQTRVRAFKTGPRVSIEYLNGFCAPENRVVTFAYKSKMTLAQAKEAYPDWYQTRIVDGKKPGTWLAKRDLYDWWKRKIEDGAVDGHRYFCIMALAIFARKSQCRRKTDEEKEADRRAKLEGKPKTRITDCVSYDELHEDAYGFIEMLDQRSRDHVNNPFTEDDVERALEAYNADYQTFPRKNLEALTGIPMPQNKRRGLPQEVHLKIARGTKKTLKDSGIPLRSPEGRPSKQEEVLRFVAKHPEMTNVEVARAIGVSRNTVGKWRKTGDRPTGL